MRDEKRIKKWVVHTGKAGYLQFLKTIYKHVGMSDTDIEIRIKKDEEELKEGLYEI